MLTQFDSIPLGILVILRSIYYVQARLVYLIITIIDLHQGFIAQILQDIPLLVNLMALMKSKSDENRPDFQLKLSLISLMFISFAVHNQDKTFDLITLLEKNVGLSGVSSYGLMLMHHVPVTECKKNENGDVSEDFVV